MTQEIQSSDVGVVDVDVFEYEDLTPLRSRKVIKISLYSYGNPVYIREWGTKDTFSMLTRVKDIVGKLQTADVFAPSRPGEDNAVRNAKIISGILTVINQAKDDVYSILMSSVYSDKDCKVTIDKDLIDSLAIGDVAALVKGVWLVNWEIGGLKKVVTAPAKKILQKTP